MLLLGCELERGLAAGDIGERCKDASVETEVCRAHVRALDGVGESERELAKQVCRVHAKLVSDDAMQPLWQRSG